MPPTYSASGASDCRPLLCGAIDSFHAIVRNRNDTSSLKYDMNLVVQSDFMDSTLCRLEISASQCGVASSTANAPGRLLVGQLAEIRS